MGIWPPHNGFLTPLQWAPDPSTVSTWPPYNAHLTPHYTGT